MPIAALEPVNPWIPKLNALATNESGEEAHAVQAIVKKEVSVASTTRMRGRSLKEVDRRKLESSIPLDAHRGLRMLCADDLLDLAIDCPVDTAAGEFACAVSTRDSLFPYIPWRINAHIAFPPCSQETLQHLP